MPCTKCSCEFGILKKEVGCEKCGFGFCPKCCKKREVQEESATVKKFLCSDCLSALSGNKPVVNISPPQLHKKRMAAFKKKSYSVDEYASSSFSHEKDRELFERLKKLKKDQAFSPSEREIEERLAKLKGMDPSKYNAPPIEVYRPPDRRTSLERAADLVMQVTEEVHLDSKRVKPEDEIAHRLAALRGKTVKQPNIPEELLPEISPESVDENISIEDSLSSFQKQSQDLSSEACKGIKELNIAPEYKELISSMKQEKESGDSEDEEEAEKLVAQLLASKIPDDLDELESNSEPSGEKSEASSKKGSLDEEFPWCVICTNNAQIRCFGCEQELYCLRCFRECHDSFEIKDHKTCPYTPSAVSAR